MKRDWKYASKETIRSNFQDLALNAIAEIIWGEIYDDSRKLHIIEGIMTLAADIDEDMTEATTEVKYDACAVD